MKPTKKNLRKVALVQLIKNCKPCQRKNIISYLDDSGIDILCEVVHNVFFHQLNLNKKTKQKLKKKYQTKKSLIQILSDKTKPVRVRKKILIQEGSGFGYIFSLAVTLLAKLLFGHA